MSQSIKSPEKSSSESRVNRRAFLRRAGTGAVAALALPGLPLPAPSAAATTRGHRTLGGTSPDRRPDALVLRDDMAQLAFDRPFTLPVTNGEEAQYPNRIGNFSKGLPHDARGEVDPAAYDALLAALDSGDPADFETIPLGLGRKLTNPQAGLAFDLEGPDSHHLILPPPPRLDSAQISGEAAELYWMSLLRDLDFRFYPNHELAVAACNELSALPGFPGPRQGGAVTPQTLFRGSTPGDLIGPYLSQFLLKDIPFGSLTISQRQNSAVPRIDYLTKYDEWLQVRNGGPSGASRLDSVPRHIRNPRDLTRYVQVDALYEAYLNACLILLGLGAPLDPGIPYNGSTTQIGFGTFGGPHILSLVTEVATRALKAVWYQKWWVHRWLRPEEFGGLVHNQLTNQASYPIHAGILQSQAVQIVKQRTGSYLLPQAFPDGSPTHPSYGSGHATVAGACVTILKAWFDESWVIPDPVISNLVGNGLSRYEGSDRGQITVGGELNKVASNIASGRNLAGIHWRSDFERALRLGEAVALGILEEQKTTYNESASFTLTTFDGQTITI